MEIISTKIELNFNSMDSEVNKFQKFKNCMELHDLEKYILKIPGNQEVTNGGEALGALCTIFATSGESRIISM